MPGAEETVFHIGLTLSIESYYKAYLTTQVVGWDENAFILTRAIYVQGQPAKLKAGDPCKVRFLEEGTAYGFETEIISVQFFPFPLMFIKYPAAISRLKLRVADRYKTNLAATFSDTLGAMIFDATILDISEGGCGAKIPVIEGKDIAPEGNYLITFQGMGGEISIPCKARKIDKGTATCFLGLEFHDMQKEHKETLNTYLEFLKKQST